MGDVRWVYALIVVATLGGCADDPIQGDRSMMLTALGQHDGFNVQACPPGFDASFAVIGDGEGYWDGVALDDRERNDAMLDFNGEVLAPIAIELDSFSFVGPLLPCDGDTRATPAAGLTDWAEVDQLIDGVGAALRDNDLRERIEILVAASPY